MSTVTLIREFPRPVLHVGRARHAVGGLFLFTAGMHLGMVMADPQSYEGFGDAGLFGFVRDGWDQIVMANPAAWGLLAMAGELALGLLLMTRGRAVKIGWTGVILFHVLLMLFGFGYWLWSVPALAVLVPLAVRDWPALSER